MAKDYTAKRNRPLIYLLGYTNPLQKGRRKIVDEVKKKKPAHCMVVEKEELAKLPETLRLLFHTVDRFPLPALSTMTDVEYPATVYKKKSPEQ